MTQDNTTSTYILNWDEIKKYFEEYNKPYQPSPYYPQPCPGCGRCPACGRGGYPWTPIPPVWS